MSSRRLSFLLSICFFGLGLHGLVKAEIELAALHPLLADLAHQVGGPEVKVISLLKPGMEIHHFEPSTADLAKLKGVRLILASGKGLESYLDKLRDSVGASAEVFEVGQKIPTLTVPGKGPDPHWWHSPTYMRRAALIVAEKFSELDPAHAAAFKANAQAAGQRFDGLKTWAQAQITVIPPENRLLVSAHNAFAYFCKDFGFRSIYILGLTAEDEVAPQDILEAIKVIKEKHIRAVFPEDQANPKILSQIVRDTGVKIAPPIDADGTAESSGGTFEGMFRHNVETIVTALKASP